MTFLYVINADIFLQLIAPRKDEGCEGAKSKESTGQHDSTQDDRWSSECSREWRSAVVQAGLWSVPLVAGGCQGLLEFANGLMC